MAHNATRQMERIRGKLNHELLQKTSKYVSILQCSTISQHIFLQLFKLVITVIIISKRCLH